MAKDGYANLAFLCQMRYTKAIFPAALASQLADMRKDNIRAPGIMSGILQLGERIGGAMVSGKSGTLRGSHAGRIWSHVAVQAVSFQMCYDWL